jgi:hypothetical protein
MFSYVKLGSAVGLAIDEQAEIANEFILGDRTTSEQFRHLIARRNSSAELLSRVINGMPAIMVKTMRCVQSHYEKWLQSSEHSVHLHPIRKFKKNYFSPDCNIVRRQLRICDAATQLVR